MLVPKWCRRIWLYDATNRVCAPLAPLVLRHPLPDGETSIYEFVCAYKRRAGQVVPWSQRALVQMLEQDELLLSTDNDGRHTAVVRAINGQRVRCWHLPVHVLGNG